VTITLVDEIDVSRGDTIVHPNNLPRVEQQFEAMVVWMAEEPLVPGKPYLIKHATNLVNGQVTTLRYRIDVNTLHREPAPVLAMNEVGRCTVALSRPVGFDPYRSNRAMGAFIFVDRLTNRTVGAGMIIDRASSLKFLQDFWEGDTAEGAASARRSAVTSDERHARFGQVAGTLLLTGLSGSGKTTVAYALERRLFDAGRAVCVLDGTQMRQTISRDLGYSRSERSENLRRSIDVARFMNDAGLICIGAFLAPDEATRKKARNAIGDTRFVEVYVSAPVEVCRQREQGGMYAKADSGEIPDFPGVSAPYEEPTQADLVVQTDTLSVDQCVDRIVTLLEAKGWLK
jgi:bifunctional enzyme CysN/CysC